MHASEIYGKVTVRRSAVRFTGVAGRAERRVIWEVLGIALCTAESAECAADALVAAIRAEGISDYLSVAFEAGKTAVFPSMDRT